MKENIIAIDLGGTSAKLAIVSRGGDIKHHWSVPTDSSEDGINIVPNIIQSITEQITEHDISVDSILGIGMGSPGSVNHIEKTVIGAFNLNWRTLQEVGKAFEESLNLPFYIDNDANIAALGEQWRGAGNKDENVVMVTLGTGVGGGIVVGGQLLHGAYGAAGEVGHITIEPNSQFECTCGKKGCLEAVASATGIKNLAQHYIKEYEGETTLSSYIESKGYASAYDIFQAALNEDEFSLMIVDKFSAYLGLASSHLANILNPSKIILGGGVSEAGEFLRSRVEKYCLEYTFDPIKENTEITLAQLGNNAGVIGAARLVIVEENLEESVN